MEIISKGTNLRDRAVEQLVLRRLPHLEDDVTALRADRPDDVALTPWSRSSAATDSSGHSTATVEAELCQPGRVEGEFRLPHRERAAPRSNVNIISPQRVPWDNSIQQQSSLCVQVSQGAIARITRRRHVLLAVVLAMAVLSSAVPGAAAPAPAAARKAASAWLVKHVATYPNWLYYASYRHGGRAYVDVVTFDGDVPRDLELTLRRGTAGYAVTDAKFIVNVSCWIGSGKVTCSSA